jgi:crossover junction endodeoxyribonuclease RusA
MLINLPYPPTANTYYRRAGHVIHLSKKGRDYKSAVAAAVRDQLGIFVPEEGAVQITLSLAPPDKRRRDLDNCLKPVLDALTGANVWLDDSQVKRLVAQMLPKTTGGSCTVEVKPL